MFLPDLYVAFLTLLIYVVFLSFMLNTLDPFRWLCFLPRVGFTFLFCPICGFLAGYYLDIHYGTAWFFLPVLLVLGVLLGWYATYRLILNFFDDDDKRKDGNT